MSTNTQDVRELAYVLRRTNYGEADRILNLITRRGKISAIAKGVRKEKSKLAGNIELFSLIDINIHQGKSELGVVTSAKMLKYYGNILVDLGKMELASLILKRISVAADNFDSADCFNIVDVTLGALDQGVCVNLVETWFWFNLLKAMGEQINLYYDVNGDKLSPDVKYEWDFNDSGFYRKDGGRFDANLIKAMRLMLSVDINTMTRVKNIEEYLPDMLKIARALNKI